MCLKNRMLLCWHPVFLCREQEGARPARDISCTMSFHSAQVIHVDVMRINLILVAGATRLSRIMNISGGRCKAEICKQSSTEGWEKHTG